MDDFVISSCGTYPGVIEHVQGILYQVRWYKWGWHRETFITFEDDIFIRKNRLDISTCKSLFGLPPTV